jgi:molybdopterin-guanine dinucleotide biosynthesis protein B
MTKRNLKRVIAMRDRLPAVVFSIAGYSRSGKTTLITELIDKIKKEGYKTATIKNSDKNISLDTVGKDTWKHKAAGAELSILNTATDSTILFADPQDLDFLIDVVNYAVEPDLILVEGRKRSELPKIWLPGGEPDEEAEDDRNIAYEYDGDIEKLMIFITAKIDVKRILEQLPLQDCGKCGHDSCLEHAEHINSGKNNIEDCHQRSEDYYIKISSQGEVVKLNKFASNIAAGILSGMARELKGVKDPEELEIVLKKNK